MASIGATITIAALAIDPFTQEVIQYYNCPQVATGDVATVPKANNFTFSGSPGGYVLDPATMAAIYKGLMDSPVNATAPITFQCPTGNCTFVQDNDGAAY